MLLNLAFLPTHTRNHNQILLNGYQLLIIMTKLFPLVFRCQATGDLIGYAGISSISVLNRSGEYFILIGNKQYWGKGIATEVTKRITDYGFKTLGLHRIELTAFVNNQSAIRAYAKAGYKHEGIKRQSGYRNGQFLDKVQMATLCHEWLAISEEV
ncbi:GNAT family N-acetyltransferase [Psychromonas sp. KJ10-10]|uniref:GNAT family N-acetyltransferase n=1 Tax=Psychromonas sp. KJ10-10 TaxID=3391823 RepID=UPI0039B49F01